MEHTGHRPPGFCVACLPRLTGEITVGSFHEFRPLRWYHKRPQSATVAMLAAAWFVPALSVIALVYLGVNTPGL